MSGPAFIYVMQALLACAWAVPLIRKSGALWRVLRQRAKGDDATRAVMWFVAAWIECGSLRWLVFSHAVQTMQALELAFWAGVYGLGICVAFAVSYVFWERHYDGY